MVCIGEMLGQTYRDEIKALHDQAGGENHGPEGRGLVMLESLSDGQL